MNGGYGGPLAGENGELCNFDRRRPWPGTMAGKLRQSHGKWEIGPGNPMHPFGSGSISAGPSYPGGLVGILRIAGRVRALG